MEIITMRPRRSELTGSNAGSERTLVDMPCVSYVVLQSVIFSFLEYKKLL